MKLLTLMLSDGEPDTIKAVDVQISDEELALPAPDVIARILTPMAISLLRAAAVSPKTE